MNGLPQDGLRFQTISPFKSSTSFTHKSGPPGLESLCEFRKPCYQILSAEKLTDDLVIPISHDNITCRKISSNIGADTRSNEMSMQERQL